MLHNFKKPPLNHFTTELLVLSLSLSLSLPSLSLSLSLFLLLRLAFPPPHWTDMCKQPGGQKVNLQKFDIFICAYFLWMEQEQWGCRGYVSPGKGYDAHLNAEKVLQLLVDADKVFILPTVAVLVTGLVTLWANKLGLSCTKLSSSWFQAYSAVDFP